MLTPSCAAGNEPVKMQGTLLQHMSLQLGDLQCHAISDAELSVNLLANYKWLWAVL